MFKFKGLFYYRSNFCEYLATIINFEQPEQKVLCIQRSKGCIFAAQHLYETLKEILMLQGLTPIMSTTETTTHDVFSINKKNAFNKRNKDLVKFGYLNLEHDDQLVKTWLKDLKNGQGQV